MKELLAEAKRRMDGALKALEADFATVRTGRASTHLLDKVVVDANHPLAGKTVKFSCTVTDVRPATQEELHHGHVHGEGGHHH